MDFATNILGLINLFFAVVIGMYFWNLLRSQQSNKTAVERESKKEMERLQRLRSISLTEPLAEKTRPVSFAEIIGQEDGLKALRAALAGPIPSMFWSMARPGSEDCSCPCGPGGSQENSLSPFSPEARFVELDATTARFDDRGLPIR